MTWRNGGSVQRWLLRGAVFSVLVLPVGQALQGAPPTNKKNIQAQALVREALAHESLGRSDEREQLLSQAAQAAPDAPAVNWAQGRVRYQDRWVSYDAIPSLASQNLPLTKYQELRGNYKDDVNNQLALAHWCAKQGLNDQSEAHLVRVLQLSPNHTVARQKLGFVRSGNNWVHEEEISGATKAAATQREQFAKWEPRISDLRENLLSKQRSHREVAAKRLNEIQDPAAIPAIEALLGYEGQEVSLPAVQTLRAMTAPEASLSLARIAIFSSDYGVRESAGKALQGRPYEQFVPPLLAAMRTQVEARQQVVEGPGGRIVHQQVFAREGQEQTEVLVLGTEYRRQFVNGGDANFALRQVNSDLARQYATSEMRLALENVGTAEQNKRISVTLEAGTKQTLGSDPKVWWEWWNNYNDLKMQGEKAVAYDVRTRSVSVLDGIPQPVSSGGGPILTAGRAHGECFVAGTPVLTNLGPVAIEQVRLGDLVLSQDVETGELAYKPVIRTSITPSGPLVKVEAGYDQQMECTGGHLFWVSGEGWKQARELRSGMQLHGPRGTLTVSSVGRRDAAQTYNLVVADFHTYFAGEKAVLSHDVTLRRPTSATVPGDAVK